MLQVQEPGCAHSLSFVDRLVPKGSGPSWIWAKNDRCVVQVLPSSEKKLGSSWFFEGKRISNTGARSQNTNRKNLDHIGFLKASGS